MLPTDIFTDYFTTNFVIAGILVAAVALVTSFSIFIFAKNHNTKSASLFSTMAISSSLWIFVFSSLAFCVALINVYLQAPEGTIVNVARLALLPTLALGPVAFYFLRKRAIKQIYPFFTFTQRKKESESRFAQERIISIFSGLLSISKLHGIGLSIVPGIPNLPASAALDWKGEKIVAISNATAQSLDDEELRAVLAHELGHIVHRDSLRKTLATAYRTAFMFDPLARFVEAAIYRHGELNADEYSAKITGKPAALASALTKIYEPLRISPSSVPNTVGVSPVMKDRDAGLFSKQPSLTLRINRLLEMEGEIDPKVDSHGRS
jgi:Zn-dependent protease with chaperone function